MEKLMEILNKIESYLIFAAKYFVYLMDLAFYRIKQYVKSYPIYSAVGGTIIIVVLFGLSLFGRTGNKWSGGRLWSNQRAQVIVEDGPE